MHQNEVNLPLQIGDLLLLEKGLSINRGYGACSGRELLTLLALLAGRGVVFVAGCFVANWWIAIV